MSKVTAQEAQDAGTYWKFPQYEGVYCLKVFHGRNMRIEDYVSAINGENITLYGFISAEKTKEFNAILQLDMAERRFKFYFPPVNELDLLCPKSRKNIDSKEKYFYFPGYPKVACWKQVSGRNMSAEDYIKILTPPYQKVLMHEFISKNTGLPYSAFLYYIPEKDKISLTISETEEEASKPKTKATKPKVTAKAADTTEEFSGFY